MSISIAAAFVFYAFIFMIVVVRIAQRDSENKRNTALIEKALDNGTIDEATKRQLLERVAGQKKGPSSIFMFGWVGLFVGLGMLVLGMADSDDWLVPAVLTTAISFGVLSTPIAMRELQARQQA